MLSHFFHLKQSLAEGDYLLLRLFVQIAQLSGDFLRRNLAPSLYMTGPTRFDATLPPERAETIEQELVKAAAEPWAERRATHRLYTVFTGLIGQLDTIPPPPRQLSVAMRTETVSRREFEALQASLQEALARLQRLEGR